MASFTAMSTLSCRVPACAQLTSPPRQIKGLGNFNGLRCCQIPRKHLSLQVRRHASSSPQASRISCQSTIEQVQDVIATQLSVDRAIVQPETKFSELGADSLDTVEIVMSLEEKFGVSIGEQDAENISTVQQVADLIEKQKVAS